MYKYGKDLSTQYIVSDILHITIFGTNLSSYASGMQNAKWIQCYKT